MTTALETRCGGIAASASCGSTSWNLVGEWVHTCDEQPAVACDHQELIDHYAAGRQGPSTSTTPCTQVTAGARSHHMCALARAPREVHAVRHVAPVGVLDDGHKPGHKRCTRSRASAARALFRLRRLSLPAHT
jgi:hypothetical protein